MENHVERKLQLFLQNVQTTRNVLGHKGAAFRWAALGYAIHGKPINIDAVQRSNELLKDSVGVRSALRGMMSTYTVAMVSLEGDPKRLLDRMSSVYEMMKDAKLVGTFSLVTAAYVVAANADPDRYGQIVARMRSYSEGIRSHIGRIKIPEYTIAASFAMSEADVEHGVEGVTQLYQHLKQEFRLNNTALALAQMMAMLEMNDKAAVDRVIALNNALKDQKLSIAVLSLSLLGPLASYQADIDTIVKAISEAQEFLRIKGRFGGFRLNSLESLRYAAAIVASGYAERTEDGHMKRSGSADMVFCILAAQLATATAAAATAGTAGAAH